MGTRLNQISRWTLKNVSLCGFSPLQVGRNNHASLRSFRFYRSSVIQTSSQPTSDLTHLNKQPITLISKQSLIDLGFTDSQVDQIHETVSRVRGGRAARQALSTLTVLFVLGLNPSTVLKMVDKCPDLYNVSEKELQLRINNLRKLGLIEGSLQRMVVYYPKILTVPAKSVINVVMFLREKCLFTVQQVTDILRDSPAVLLEDLDQLEYKFQYVYFRMGVKQSEMVKSRLFRFTLQEVRCRHSFLERRGLYQTPDKKGQTTIVNPKLDSILNVERQTFVEHIALASAQEYNVFEKLLEREMREEEFQPGRIETDDDNFNDEGEADDSEEEETVGKSGYRRKKKSKR